MATGTDILFTCSYLPTEIVEAAGFRPVRAVPSAPRPSDADADIHPTTCPYIRAVCAAAANGDWKNAAGIVIVNSCDGMRRLYDALEVSKTAPPAIFLDVPHKQDDAAVDFFASLLKQFVRRMEETFSAPRITADALEQAIVDVNARRKRMAALFELLSRGGISGGGAWSLLMEDAAGNGREVSERIGGLAAAAAADGGKRIMISANVLDRPDLIGMIEGAGGTVVALDGCVGLSRWEGLVEEGSADPIRAIAHRYLTRIPCARMEGIGRRIDRLIGLAESSRANAVVLCTVKYCDAWLYDRPLVIQRLQDAGLRVLSLENDYEWTGAAQTRTRVEAFVETLPGGGT